MSTANSFAKFIMSGSLSLNYVQDGHVLTCPAQVRKPIMRISWENESERDPLDLGTPGFRWSGLLLLLFWDMFLAGYVWQAQRTFPSLFGGARGVLTLEVIYANCRQKSNVCSGRMKLMNEGNLTRVHSGALQRAPGLGGGRAGMFV